jgi:hypothetical protein
MNYPVMADFCFTCSIKSKVSTVLLLCELVVKFAIIHHLGIKIMIHVIEAPR